MFKLTFLGATGTVTGSKYLLTTQGQRLLIDCGLFQGNKDLRLRNWTQLPVKAKSIDAVFITHAHIDHTGYLPLLIKDGFKGPIYCSIATFDLCQIMLLDSAKLQEEDARLANKHHFTKHQPAIPLYTEDDVNKTLAQMVPLHMGEIYNDLFQGEVQFLPNGHIIGSTYIRFSIPTKSSPIKHEVITFSGDVGRPFDPILFPPTPIYQTNYLVIESTYGNKLHEKTDPQDALEQIINDTYAKGGSLIIPAFAVGRTQHLLYYMNELRKQKRLPSIPIFLDSPMTIRSTEILCKHYKAVKQTAAQLKDMCETVIFTSTAKESKAIEEHNGPKIIISASGMATGGRILHHLKVYAPDPNSTILLTGYQANGTRGQRLLSGEKEIKIHGQMYPVLARVASLSNMSAHGDYQEIIDWLSSIEQKPTKVFITHGEQSASEEFKHKLTTQFGWDCVIPKYLDEFEL